MGRLEGLDEVAACPPRLPDPITGSACRLPDAMLVYCVYSACQAWCWSWSVHHHTFDLWADLSAPRLHRNTLCSMPGSAACSPPNASDVDADARPFEASHHAFSLPGMYIITCHCFSAPGCWSGTNHQALFSITSTPLPLPTRLMHACSTLSPASPCTNV